MNGLLSTTSIKVSTVDSTVDSCTYSAPYLLSVNNKNIQQTLVFDVISLISYDN